MSRLNSKQLVLDANLALGSNDLMFNPVGDAAGDRNRRCLQAVWEEEHVAVFNRQLQREWREHASPSASRCSNWPAMAFRALKRRQPWPKTFI
jgi:hypothetical protein